MNVLLSRLDEQQRRWYLMVESERLGHGADRILYEITGVDEKTIRRGVKNWVLPWWTARSTGCACRVAAANAESTSSMSISQVTR